ncbi:MAG: hypothetical protein JST12_05010 [Armatimonadetes bacterium]|nr:hypothetical protein [Armatimonadota bacterium]MBS1701000.1 hypothetical protein [Armatimonadota bacterium]MBS1727846.1 hypothetical protein [Armatimonadota bacterium]
MKKKKPPVLLASVLVFAGLGLVIYSQKWGFYNKSMEEQQQIMQQEAMDAAKAHQKPEEQASNVDVSKEVEEAQNRAKQAGGASAADSQKPTDEMHALSKVPTVVMPDRTQHKPVPNPASPHSQWYDGQ